MTQSLAATKFHALRVIDVLAGEARTRYITDVPGQQAVYIKKLEEARAYLLFGPTFAAGTPGPHLVAEAAALGITAAVLAQNVETLGTYWQNTISPAIEAARIQGKAAVNAATTNSAVAAALTAAETAIKAL
jgi:hypothetical protein